MFLAFLFLEFFSFLYFFPSFFWFLSAMKKGDMKLNKKEEIEKSAWNFFFVLMVSSSPLYVRKLNPFAILCALFFIFSISIPFLVRPFWLNFQREKKMKQHNCHVLLFFSHEIFKIWSKRWGKFNNVKRKWETMRAKYGMEAKILYVRKYAKNVKRWK